MSSESRPSRRLRTLLLPSLLATFTLAAPAALLAQPARVQVTVLDPSGKPIPDVQVHVTTTERGDVKVNTTTNPKGRATVMVPNVALTYDMALEREGYASLQVPLKPTLGETTFKEYTLIPVGAKVAAPASDAPSQPRTFTPAEQAFNEGVEALGKSDFDTALAKFLDAREKDSSLTQVHSALASVYLEKKQPKEALASAQRFLEAEPGNPRGLRLVYEAQKDLGNQAEAAKALKELQSKKGADVATLLYNEGAESLKVGDLEGAQARFEEALVAQPDLRQADEALMVVYGRKNDWAKAAAQAEKVIAADPKNLRALRTRREAYAKLGDSAKEKEALDALAQADPTALAASLLDSGISKFNQNDTAGAIADLSRSIELDPKRPTAHYFLGMCHANNGKNAEAREHLQKFLELAPDDPNAAGAREMLKYLK
jgi:tetratricopeptide (TPR) repeat protein